MFSTLSERLYYRKFPSIVRALGGLGEPSYTGKDINETTAFNNSVVWACTRVISDPLGMLPLHLYKRVGDDERTRDRANSLYWLLHNAPNPYTPATVFRQTLQRHALTWGNGYAQIVRRSDGSDMPISLHILPPDQVGVLRNKADGTPYYRVQTTEGTQNLQWRDVLHIPGLGFDGYCGDSVISLAKNSIGLDMSALEYGGRFFARGGRVPYILKHQNKFKSDQEYDAFRDRWNRIYDNAHDAVMLEGGIEYQQIGFKPEDSQLLATRKFSVEEICRWFLVYPFEVGDMSRANFSNIEQLTIDRIFHTLGYWLKVWEEQITLRLLPASMQRTHFAEFDRNAILMGDFETRMKGYVNGLQNGVINPDFVCARENWPKLPNGAGGAYHIQLNMQTVPGTGEPTAVERAQLARAESTSKRPTTEGATSNAA